MGNAGNGLWIGPKTWDRKCRNSLETLGVVRDNPEFQWVWFGLTCVLNGWYELGREWPWISGSLSEPLFCDFSGIVNEGFTIPGIML